MIPVMNIIAWGNVVPWVEQRQVDHFTRHGAAANVCQARKSRFSYGYATAGSGRPCRNPERGDYEGRIQAGPVGTNRPHPG